MRKKIILLDNIHIVELMKLEVMGDGVIMKKMILGIVWQVLGFWGAISLICVAAPERWDYNGITGLLGSLLGLDLIYPLVGCVALFVLGIVLCLLSIRSEEK